MEFASNLRRVGRYLFPASRFALLLAVPCLLVVTLRAESLQITSAQAEAAGKKLWRNECNGTVAGLTSWNSGENFASLGIGHYIWYPAGHREGFEESFPLLVAYLQAHGATLPTWLRPGVPCPWNSRAEFMGDLDSARMKELRQTLAATVALQAAFSAERLEAALGKMRAASSPGDFERIRAQFYRVAASPDGVYALVDYVNFKGEGVLTSERYQGQGWGLMQVLSGMPASGEDRPGAKATADFARSASDVLTHRVANSPPERHEAKWLPGWKSRVATYHP